MLGQDSIVTWSLPPQEGILSRKQTYFPLYRRSTSKNHYPRFPDDSGGDHYGGAGWPILPLTGPTYLDGWTSTPLQALVLLAVVVSDRAAHFMPLTNGLRVFMVGGVMGLCPQSLFLFRQNIQCDDHYFCVLLLYHTLGCSLEWRYRHAINNEGKKWIFFGMEMFLTNNHEIFIPL